MREEVRKLHLLRPREAIIAGESCGSCGESRFGAQLHCVTVPRDIYFPLTQRLQAQSVPSNFHSRRGQNYRLVVLVEGVVVAAKCRGSIGDALK